MRIMSFYVVVAITTTWAVISIKNNALLEIDTTQIIAILGAMGMKVGQKYIETDAGGRADGGADNR